MTDTTALDQLLPPCFDARAGFVDDKHQGAFRLFNGFTEGLPTLVLDVYARTLVVNDHSKEPGGDPKLAEQAWALAKARFDWLDSALHKIRHAPDEARRSGQVLHGEKKQLARRVVENGVTYALDLTLNRDASFYVDTRAVRAWARANLAGKHVLNAFAYTGSLGVAARAAPARRVLHTDLNKAFLTVAKDSYAMNGWAVEKKDFRAGDFFDVIGELKRRDVLFDCVFLDPPFFSVTEQGRVDLEADMARIVNKVRPLVGHEGTLVAINNGAFVSGKAYEALLDELSGDYLSLETRIDVPEDVTGFPATKRGAPLTDPAPFNHSTKVAVMKVVRKDGRRAG